MIIYTLLVPRPNAGIKFPSLKPTFGTDIGLAGEEEDQCWMK